MTEGREEVVSETLCALVPPDKVSDWSLVWPLCSVALGPGPLTSGSWTLALLISVTAGHTSMSESGEVGEGGRLDEVFTGVHVCVTSGVIDSAQARGADTSVNGWEWPFFPLPQRLIIGQGGAPHAQLGGGEWICVNSNGDLRHPSSANTTWEGEGSNWCNTGLHALPSFPDDDPSTAQGSP